MNNENNKENLIQFPQNKATLENQTDDLSESNDISSQGKVVEVKDDSGNIGSIQPEDSDDSSLTFKIENFEGPLDLLLHLIKKSKVEIEDVRLSDITEQYLSIMEQIEKVDLEVASEFIEVAATLIEIKSKALLPKLQFQEEEEEDSEALLLQRLNEYKLLKESSEKLKSIENVDRFYKKPEKQAHKYRIVLKDMELDMLLNAFTRILHRAQDDEKDTTPKEVQKEIFTVSGKITAIKEALVHSDKINFKKLFQQSSTRDEIITTFLAILEMLKANEITCKQQDVFNDIEILKVEKD